MARVGKSRVTRIAKEFPSSFAKGTLGYVLDQERGIEGERLQRYEQIAESLGRPSIELRIWSDGSDLLVVVKDWTTATEDGNGVTTYSDARSHRARTEVGEFSKRVIRNLLSVVFKDR